MRVDGRGRSGGGIAHGRGSADGAGRRIGSSGCTAFRFLAAAVALIRHEAHSEKSLLDGSEGSFRKQESGSL
jgi:hypothetical protein